MLLTSTFEVKVREIIAREFPGLAMTDWSIHAKADVFDDRCCPVGSPNRSTNPYGRYEVRLTLEEAPPSVVAAMVAIARAE